MTEEQIADDIREHFSHQLQQLVRDTVNTARIADIRLEQIVALVTVPLICEVVVATEAAGLDTVGFLTLCADVQRGLHKQADNHKNKAH